MKHLFVVLVAVLMGCEPVLTENHFAEVQAVYECAKIVYGGENAIEYGVYVEPPKVETYKTELEYIRRCDVYEVGDTYQEMCEYDEIYHILYP